MYTIWWLHIYLLSCHIRSCILNEMYFVWFCNKKFLSLLLIWRKINWNCFWLHICNLKCAMYIICWYLMRRMSLFHRELKNKNDAKLFHDLIARISNCANKTNSKIHRASKLVHLIHPKSIHIKNSRSTYLLMLIIFFNSRD